MARLWSSGFELGGFLDWHTSNITAQTTTVRSGTYAAESVLVSGSARGAKYIFQASPNNGPFYFRVYLRVATRPSAENKIIALSNADSLTATQIVWLTHDNNGVLKLYDEDGQITGTTTLSTNTQYRIEVEFDRTAAAGSQVVRARVDGVEFAGSATRNLSAGIWIFVIGANLTNEAQTVGSWFFDDCAINNNVGSFQNSYPGEGEIIHLRPNGTGDNSAWTNDYTTIDEVTPNDATDFISSNTNNQIEDVNLDATPAAMDSGDIINCVQVGVRYNLSDATGADPTAVLRIKASASGTVEESGNLITNSTTWNTNNPQTPKNYNLTLYDLPGASTTAWTKADLDTAQIGVRESATDTHFIQVSTLWLLVDHKPGSITEFLDAAGSVTPTSALIIQPKTTYSGSITPTSNLIRSALASYAGSVTPTGSLIKKVITAYSGQTTPTGEPDLSAQTSFSGSVTPTGALTVARIFILALDASVTATSSLIKKAITAYTGQVSPSGDPDLSVQTSFSGSVTPTGALAVLRIVLLSLSGSVTATGNLIKKAITAYSGQVSPSGEPDYSVQTRLSGSVTPTGALSVLRLVLLSVAGSVTPTGNLIKSAGKLLAGSVTASSNIIKSVRTAYTGQITPDGQIDASVQTRLSGSVTPTSTLSNIRLSLLSLSGSVTAVGNLIKKAITAYSGQTTPSGQVMEGVQTRYSGSVTATGALSLIPIIGGAATSIVTLFKGMYKGMFKGMR